MIVLETARLTLRHLEPSDLDALATIQADPEVMRFFPAGPRSRDLTERDLTRCVATQAEHGFSLWATIDNASGTFIGRCGLLPQALGGIQEVEIAYLIARSHWGRGLATEAARAIRDHGLHQLGHKRLVSIIHRDHVASQRVAEKNGLRRERLVQFMSHRCWLYAIEAPQATKERS